MLLKNVDEKRRHRRLRPVVVELALLEALPKRDGVYDGFGVLLELIAVVPLDDPLERLPVSEPVRYRKGVETFWEILLQ